MKRAALVLLAGCNAAFGIQYVDPDAAIDAGAPPVPAIAGTVVQGLLANDPNLVPTISRRVLPATSLSIFVADAVTGLDAQVAYNETDGSFTIPPGTGDRTRVQLRLGTFDIEYQWNLPTLHVELEAYARLGELPAAANTTLIGAYQPANATRATLLATGIWQGNPVKTDVPNARYAVDLSGGNLESGAARDQLIFVAYDFDMAGNLVLDQRQIVSNYEVKSAIANTLDVTLAPLAPDTCIHATTNLAADAARIEMFSTGFGAAQTSAALEVYALPMPVIGTTVQWSLGNTPNTEDATISVNRTTFPNFTVVPTTVVSRARTLPNGAPIGVNMVHYEELAGTSCTTTTAFPVASVAFASAITLAGSALTSDTATAHFAAPTAELTWTTNGAADLYLIQIYDATTNTYVPHQVYTTAAHATIDALMVGHAYVFVINSVLGLPNVADGDLTTHAYPFESSIAISSLVTVQ